MDIQKILAYYNLKLNKYEKCICPFHTESKPSLSFDLDKGIFYCFGCGTKGDIVDFVSRIEKINKLKALQKIQSIAKNSFNSKSLEIKRPNKDWVEEAKKEYLSYNLIDWSMPNYLTKRGFIPKALNVFEIRVNPLSDYIYVIPLYEKGKFKGYVKRTKDNRSNKYLYNFGFRRRLTLVGTYFKSEEFPILITEGILDFLKAKQYHTKNTICLLGWKASVQQIRKLKKCTNIIIAALDNDKKGKEGIEYLKKFFKVIEFKYPSKIKDVCEMSKKQFKKSYREALDETKKIKKKRIKNL